MKYIFLFTALFLPYCFSFPIPILGRNFIERMRLLEFAKNYVKQYYNSNTLLEGINKMRTFFGMPKTGLLDTSIIEIMLKSRCGLPDVTESDKSPAWKKNNLTYRIMSYTSDLPKYKVDESIKKALEVWSDVTPLTFRKVNTLADIEILFAYGAHGDGNPFDGRRGTLAHAYFPGDGIGGDAHFDEAEDWSESDEAHGDGNSSDGRGGTLAHGFFPGRGLGGDAHFDETEQRSESDEGINFFLVAAHEFGHSLGLEHTNVRGALMYPTYSYVNPTNFRLHNDDRQRIQRLYGTKE